MACLLYKHLHLRTGFLFVYYEPFKSYIREDRVTKATQKQTQALAKSFSLLLRYSIAMPKACNSMGEKLESS